MRTNPHIGKLVTSLENDLGIGKIIDSNREAAVIEYFDSPASAERPTRKVAMTSVRRVKKLGEQTRVYFFDAEAGYWRIGRVHQHVDQADIFIDLPNEGQARLTEGEIHVRWNQPIKDPCDHLVARISETPFFHSARADLIACYVRQRAAAAGMTGLLSSSIALERHQVEVIRRVLQDPMQRYLLADEVGLGKTIEAGVIIRQYVLDHPKDHRVLVIAPETLIAQWKTELSERCQVGARFGHQLTLVALEELTAMPREQLAAGMVVVDEAHQSVRGWEESAGSPLRIRFEVLRAITAPEAAPRLLLLSATPVRRNEDGFLALLHLLDPVVYSLSDKELFRDKVAKRQQLADLFYAFTEDQQNFFLEEMVEQLAGMFPQDDRILALLNRLRPHLELSVPEDSAERRDAIRAVRIHLSETYRLHRRLLRNRRTPEVEGLLPGRVGLKVMRYSDDAARLAEQALERWRVAAAASVWGREDSEEARRFSRIFSILLEATLCDLRALAWCAAERIHAGQHGCEAFGRLTSSDRLAVLHTQPHFAEEKILLQNILKAAQSVADPNRVRIETIGGLIEEQLAKGFCVVVFASSPHLADQLFNFMAIARCTPVLRCQLEGPSWLAFREINNPAALVCDFRAEEGLNLQGGNTCLLHADFPLSPNRMEQRMGRLDRFGVGSAVRSLALLPKECPYHQAWIKCLSSAYQVFSRSIAALQYVVEDEMRGLTSTLFTEGEPALGESISRLGGEQGVLQRELKAIRAQDELDAIDVLSNSAYVDLTAGIDALEEDSAVLQQTVENWLGDRLHFTRVGENGPKDNVVRYHYGRVGSSRSTLMAERDFALWFARALDREVRHPVFLPPLTWALSYFRETARRRNVGIGRIGNPVLDCLHHYLRWDDRGTCFAFWRVSPLRQKGEVALFFRFDFVVEASIAEAASIKQEYPRLSIAAVRRRADAAFPPMMRTLWISEDLEVVNGKVLAELQKPYVKGVNDINLNQERWPQVQRHFSLANWSYRCRTAQTAAEEYVVGQVDLAKVMTALASRLEEETGVVKEQCQSRIEALAQFPREAGLAREEMDLELRVRKALLAGIRKPGIHLDAAGAVFLAGFSLV
jgi:ATP-dependent helicase HepA